MDFNGRTSTARSAQAGIAQNRRQEPHELDAFMIVSAWIYDMMLIDFYRTSPLVKSANHYAHSA